MRRFVLAAVMFGMAAGAHAADMPDYLRGSFPGEPPPSRNWDGWYAGGQATYASSATDFSQSVVGLTNFIFRNSVLQQPTADWSLLQKTNGQASGFGAFVGRNYQWDDLVFGVEANYNYLVDLTTSTSGSNSLRIVNPPGDTPPPGITDAYDVTLTGKAAAQVKDVITFRGRAGWATGDFLPYIFGGIAVGRMDISRSVTSLVTLTQYQTTTTPLGVTTTTILGAPNQPVPAQSQTQSQERTNNFVAGLTGGIGLEYMLGSNLFLRGEWEYIKFISMENTVVTLNSLHAGIGYKF